MSAIRSAATSMPADSRIRPSGAVSAGHLARRSQVDSTPPRLVAGRMSAEAATAASAAAAESSSNDSSGPKPAGICVSATARAAPVSRPG